MSYPRSLSMSARSRSGPDDALGVGIGLLRGVLVERAVGGVHERRVACDGGLKLVDAAARLRERSGTALRAAGIDAAPRARLGSTELVTRRRGVRPPAPPLAPPAPVAIRLPDPVLAVLDGPAPSGSRTVVSPQPVAYASAAVPSNDAPMRAVLSEVARRCHARRRIPCAGRGASSRASSALIPS